MRRFASLLAAALIVPGVFAGAAHADMNVIVAPTASRQPVRVYVSPVRGDPAWTVPGVNFVKQANCATSAGDTPSATWPVASIWTGGTASAVLFNPGQPRPDGTYTASADDGFNTIYVPIDLPASAKSLICKGQILANGRDVTLSAPGAVAADTLVHIAATGPLTVKMALDPAKLAAVPRKTIAVVALPAVPKIHAQGNTFVHVFGSFDPDTGAITTSPQPAIKGGISIQSASIGPDKLWHVILGASAPAQIAASADTQPNAPNYAACLAAPKTTFVEIPVKDVHAACVRTKDGRTTEIFVATGNLGSLGTEGGVTIYYTVWEKP